MASAPDRRARCCMLEEEGFVFDRYIDIFDVGPTVIAPTDHIRTVRESPHTVLESAEGGKQKMLLATGGEGFRRCFVERQTNPAQGSKHRRRDG